MEGDDAAPGMDWLPHLHTSSPLRVWNHDENKDYRSNKVFGIITDHITDSLSLEATKTESRHADHDSHLAALQSTVHSTAHCTPLHIESSMSPRVAAAPRPWAVWSPAPANERASWSPIGQSEARNWHLRQTGSGWLHTHPGTGRVIRRKNPYLVFLKKP